MLIYHISNVNLPNYDFDGYHNSQSQYNLFIRVAM